MPNKELLQKTIDFIEANPARWDQSNWAKKNECGTAFCFAGWAVQLAKLPDEHLTFRWYNPGDLWADDTTEYNYEIASALDGNGGLISSRAIDVLEIDSLIADNLFDGDNSFDDLKRMVANLMQDKPIRDGFEDDEDDYDEDAGCGCDRCHCNDY